MRDDHVDQSPVATGRSGGSFAPPATVRSVTGQTALRRSPSPRTLGVMWSLKATPSASGSATPSSLRRGFAALDPSLGGDLEEDNGSAEQYRSELEMDDIAYGGASLCSCLPCVLYACIGDTAEDDGRVTDATLGVFAAAASQRTAPAESAQAHARAQLRPPVQHAPSDGLPPLRPTTRVASLITDTPVERAPAHPSPSARAPIMARPPTRANGAQRSPVAEVARESAESSLSPGALTIVAYQAMRQRQGSPPAAALAPPRADTPSLLGPSTRPPQTPSSSPQAMHPRWALSGGPISWFNSPPSSGASPAAAPSLAASGPAQGAASDPAANAAATATADAETRLPRTLIGASRATHESEASLEGPRGPSGGRGSRRRRPRH
jgi:hypothetical protein